MKVLIADKFEQSGIDGPRGRRLRGDLPAGSQGRRADAGDRRDAAADVLVVRGTKVTAAMLDAGRLSLVVRAGAGYNTIDVARPRRRAASTCRTVRARTPSRSPS